jgi:hypothetical protein
MSQAVSNVYFHFEVVISPDGAESTLRSGAQREVSKAILNGTESGNSDEAEQ